MMMKCPNRKTAWCAGCDHESDHKEKPDCKKPVINYCGVCVPVDDEREETREEICIRNIETAKGKVAKYQSLVDSYQEKVNRWKAMVSERESELKTIRSANENQKGK